MKETDEILGKIKEEGAAYFAKDRGNKVEVGLYLEKLIEEHGMKKKEVVRKLNLADTQRLLDIGQKPRLYPRIRYDAAIIYGLEEKMTLEEMNAFLEEIHEDALL